MNRLSKLRENAGLTQQEVATTMAVPVESVMNIERLELRLLEIGTLREYLDALGCTLELGIRRRWKDGARMTRPTVLSEADVQALIDACQTPEERALVDLGLRGARAGEVGLPRLVQYQFRRVARRAGVECNFHNLRQTWRARQVVSS